MNAKEMFARGRHPSAKANLTFRDLACRHRQLVDGHPWHTLTAADLSAMRSGRFLSFTLNTLRGTSGIGTETRQGRFDIPVPGRVEPPLRGDLGPDPWTGFEFQPLLGVPTQIGTTLSMLRPGDRARLQWWPDGWQTKTTADAGLHHDGLILEVARSEEVFIFLIASRVCTPDCRMIRTFDPAIEPGLAGIEPHAA